MNQPMKEAGQSTGFNNFDRMDGFSLLQQRAWRVRYSKLPRGKKKQRNRQTSRCFFSPSAVFMPSLLLRCTAQHPRDSDGSFHGMHNGGDDLPRPVPAAEPDHTHLGLAGPFGPLYEGEETGSSPSRGSGAAFDFRARSRGFDERGRLSRGRGRCRGRDSGAGRCKGVRTSASERSNQPRQRRAGHDGVDLQLVPAVALLSGGCSWPQVQ